jgi:F-type H+-transporting ATPase subunit delta
VTPAERALAKRYGRAFLQASEKDSRAAAIPGELRAARGAVDEFAPFLRNPRVSAAQKNQKLQQVLSGRASELTMRFLRFLVDKKRLELLAAIEASVEQMVLEKNHAAKAEVTSAHALSAESQKRIQEELGRFSGKRIELDVKQDPALLGGVVVRLGDWVIDSSLRGRLRGLYRSMTGQEFSQGGSHHGN